MSRCWQVLRCPSSRYRETSNWQNTSRNQTRKLSYGHSTRGRWPFRSSRNSAIVFLFPLHLRLAASQCIPPPVLDHYWAQTTFVCSALNEWSNSTGRSIYHGLSRALCRSTQEDVWAAKQTVRLTLFIRISIISTAYTILHKSRSGRQILWYFHFFQTHAAARCALSVYSSLIWCRKAPPPPAIIAAMCWTAVEQSFCFHSFRHLSSSSWVAGEWESNSADQSSSYRIHISTWPEPTSSYFILCTRPKRCFLLTLVHWSRRVRCYCI